MRNPCVEIFGKKNKLVTTSQFLFVVFPRIITMYFPQCFYKIDFFANIKPMFIVQREKMDMYKFCLKGFIADLHGGGVVLKQLNYPISMLPILFRSVDIIANDHVNDPCRRCKFTQVY